MKYISSLCLGALLIGTTAQAQTDSTNSMPAKKHSFKSLHGHEVLPQKGDWAIGISATGFLNYIGNMMNNTVSNTAPTFNSANEPSAFGVGNLGGVALMGKYMRSNDFAYRVRFQVNAGSNTNRNDVLKSLPTPDPLNPVFVEDKLTTESHVALLSFGFEKRRGSSRLQGFYGAEAMVGFAGSTKKYNYGNGFTSDYNTPLATTDFNNGIANYQSVRIKESFTGNRMLLGARGFIGAEYFFAPKMSLGGEIGYTLGVSTTGKGYNTTEQWFSGTGVTADVTTKTDGNGGLSSWGIGLDNINAGINLHLYF
jgi:hypothetical protein